MKKVKVLEVSGSLKIGGLENVVMEIVRVLDGERYDIDVLVFGNEIGDYESEIEQRGGRVLHVNCPMNPFSFEQEINKVLIDNGPYDIIHSHIFLKSGLVMKVATRNNIKKRISHAHSVKRKGNRGIIRMLYEIYARYLLVKYSTDFLACSDEAGEYVFGKRRFRKYGKVLPNCINIKKYLYSKETEEFLKNQYGIDRDTIVLGQVGHLTKAKNQRFLLEIFKKYSTNHESVLFIVGEGELETELMAYAQQLQISEKVFFLGKRDDVNCLLSIMDVYVCTSVNEGFGIVLLEAQANGLPVVVERNVVVKSIANLGNCFMVDGFLVIDEWIEKIESARFRGRNQEVVDCLLNSRFSDIQYSKYVDTVYNDK